MKYKKIYLAGLVFSLGTSILLTACSDKSNNTVNQTVQEFQDTQGANNTESTSNTSKSDVTVKLDSEDYYFNWKEKDYETIDLSVENKAINKSGIYEIKGNLTDGSLVVDVDKAMDDGIIYLVLNEVNISSSNSAPIYIKGAEKVVLILENGTENIIHQGSEVQVNEDNEPSAAIFSKGDLTITGSGSLKVTGEYNDGITSKDKLKITDGNIEVTATQVGIVGKDLLAVENADIKVVAGKHGLRSTNEVDEGKGNIVVLGGTFDINAKVDGLQAYNTLEIKGGTYNIECEDDGIHSDGNVKITDGDITIKKAYEGIEGINVTINGGKINLIAEDDGININDSNGMLSINGGETYINASGDGLDSNGNIEMTGGIVYVDGPTNDGNGALDYDRNFNITGGTLIAAGSMGMAQAPEGGTQPSILMYYSSIQNGGTSVTLKDSNNNEVATYTPNKNYSSVVISNPNLKPGDTYTLYSGDTKVVEFQLGETVTYVNESGVTTRQDGFRGGQKGERPQGERPQGGFPQGEVPKGDKPQGGMPPGEKVDINTNPSESTSQGKTN